MNVVRDFEDIQAATVKELAEMVNLDLIKSKPPVFRCLEILQTPQSLLVAVLKVHQSRVSILQSGKKQLTIKQQEILCNLADLLIAKCQQDLHTEFATIESLVATGNVEEGWQERVNFQIEFASIMNKLQQAHIKREREDCYEENNNA